MKKVFSWVIVLSGFLFFLGIWVMPFINQALIPLFVFIPMVMAIISAAGIIVLLIKERIKDREEEKDDISKY